jgi:hypothetical protein
MRTARVLFALILGALLSIGCGGGGGGNTGTLSLRITDAPFPSTECLAHAWIQVTGVEVQSETGWIEIPLAAGATGQFDLLDLVGGLDAQLAVGELPTGTYHQIRLHLESATLEFTDGETKEFVVPSGMQSGIKINVNPQFLIATGQTTPILLDFSLAESFHVTGVGGAPTCEDLRTDKTIFNPVIHAVNTDTSGVVGGIVYYEGGTTPAPNKVIVAVVAGGDPATSTTTTVSADGDPLIVPIGAYALHLDPGSYDLYVGTDTDADDDDLPDAFEGLATDVVVVSRQLTALDLTLSDPAPAP